MYIESVAVNLHENIHIAFFCAILTFSIMPANLNAVEIILHLRLVIFLFLLSTAFVSEAPLGAFLFSRANLTRRFNIALKWTSLKALVKRNCSHFHGSVDTQTHRSWHSMTKKTTTIWLWVGRHTRWLKKRGRFNLHSFYLKYKL